LGGICNSPPFCCKKNSWKFGLLKLNFASFSGYRLIAAAVLPIDKGTLVYGSSDGGKTCKKSSEVVNQMMSLCADYLNLKPHLVTDARVTVAAPVDIEVHFGFDKRVYVLDTGTCLALGLT